MKKLLPLLLVLLILLGVSCDLEKIEPGGGGGPMDTFETHSSLGANKTIYIRSVVEAVDGGCIISGYTSRNDVNIQQLFVVKTSEQVSDGGFVFAGRYGDNADDVLLVKLNEESKLN